MINTAAGRSNGSAEPDAKTCGLSVAGLVALLGVPYLLAGPGWFREDFDALAFVRSDGILGAAGPIVSRNRPVTGLVYAWMFGVLGDHPALAFIVVLALLSIAAVLVRRVLEPEFGPSLATAAAALYALSPSQSSIVHWSSTANVLLAMVLLLLSVRAIQTSRRWWLSGLLVAIAVLAYEAVVPAALVVWLFHGWRDRRIAGPMLSMALATPSVVWVATTSTNADPYLLRAADGLGSLFGWGLIEFSPWWRLCLIGTFVGVVVSVWRLVRGQVDDDAKPERLVIAGLVVIAVGWSPFVLYGFGMDFTGQGDRANFIAAAGAAMIYAGLGGRLVRAGRDRGRVVVVAVPLCLVAMFLPQRLTNSQDWAAVWDETRTALLDAAQRTERPAHIPECPIERDGVLGLETSWISTRAMQWQTGDAAVVAECGAP